MNILLGLSNLALGLIIGGGALAVIIVFVLLYVLVISKKKYKKQVKDLARKFSYLDALLVGQDSQYIHRLEIISRTNLLYVDRYEVFSKRFKEVYENDDKYAESMIRQCNSLIAAKQYKTIKSVINETKQAISVFEESSNALDHDLYEVIRVEEELRQSILGLKEEYRRVKQTYLAQANELESISASFTKIFDKLDATFATIEEYIEGAEYDEANSLVPTAKRVIEALSNSLELLPNLCSLIQNIIPEKIKSLNERYKEVERRNLPLFHLGYKAKEESWKKTLVALNKKINNLQTVGVNAECERIQNEILSFYHLLDDEISDESYFKSECDRIYNNVLELEKNFLRICSLLPEIKQVYFIDEEQSARIENLRQNVNRLGEARRILDGFIHSGTRQPFSVMKTKLDELNSDYEIAATGVKDFKAFIESLKATANEAFDMVFAYYYRTKQMESYIRAIDVPTFTATYQAEIETIFDYINDVDKEVKKQPINISVVRDLIEKLKNYANEVFEDIENKYREAQLAESAVVYANRDRNHQNDVHQQLTQLENLFYQGEFEKVYHDANTIYCRNHVEENNGH